MVHRQYSGPHSFENTDDQSWNNMPAEQVDVESAREPSVQNEALVYPVENINQEVVWFTETWTAPRSTGFVPFGGSDGFPHHQPNIAAPSKDPFIHQSGVGTFKSVPESFDRHASSSNYVCHAFYDADSALTEPNIDTHMQRLKRKAPMIPSAYEAGSSSRYYFSGSSSNFPVASEICHEKPRNDSVQMPCHWFCTDDCYNCNGIEIRSEGSLRNIRSRTEVDPNYNDARVPVPTNASHSTIYISNAIEHCSMVNHRGQNSNALTCQWNNNMISHAHGRALTPDPGIFRLELGRAFVGSKNGATCEAVSSDVLLGRNSVACHSCAPFEAVSSDVLSGRNSAPHHGFHGPLSQSLRHSRNNYSQRSSRDFRHPSNGMHSGNMGLSETRLHSGSDGYQRHRRPVLGVGWHHGDRNRRSRVCHERYRLFHEPEGGHHHKLDYEGLMAMDHSTLYASRNMYDQHRDLRLDIDSMSYEDLLALGESIGSVSTGLSEDAMKKCLIEPLYCSYDQLHDDRRCVICLEEYGNTDKIGKLKACGHDYHVSCVKKWLSMKNLCPICKAPALEEEVVKQRTNSLEIPRRSSQGKAAPAWKTKGQAPKSVDRSSRRVSAPVLLALIRLQEELRNVKNQLNNSDSEKTRVQAEAAEARKQLVAVSKQHGETRSKLLDLSDSEDARFQELKMIFLERDKAWQSELEAVHKQKSLDSATLSSAMNEIKKLKLQLERFSESKAARSKHTESAYHELRNIGEELSETLVLVESQRNELGECQDSDARALEMVGNTQMLLDIANVTAETSHSEAMKAGETLDVMSYELEQSRAREAELETVVRDLQEELDRGQSDRYHESSNFGVRDSDQLKFAVATSDIRYYESHMPAEVEASKHSRSMPLPQMDDSEEVRKLNAENDLLKENLKKQEMEMKEVGKDAAALLDATKSAEQEALTKLGRATEDADKNSERAAQATRKPEAARAANSETEAELRRTKVQLDRWRKAAELAAAMLSGANDGKFTEIRGSVEYSHFSLDDGDDDDGGDGSPTF